MRVLLDSYPHPSDGRLVVFGGLGVLIAVTALARRLRTRRSLGSPTIRFSLESTNEQLSYTLSNGGDPQGEIHEVVTGVTQFQGGREVKRPLMRLPALATGDAVRVEATLEGVKLDPRPLPLIYWATFRDAAGRRWEAKLEPHMASPQLSRL